MKKVFRPKTEPIIGAQRPDAFPHSDAIKEFIQDCKDLGAYVSLIAGTNHMFLMVKDPQDRLQTINEILPGNWVVKDGDRLSVATDKQVLDALEEIPGASWVPTTSPLE